MSRHGWMIFGLCLLTFAQLGCKTDSRRILRQPVVEEYNPPPTEMVSDGPYYPEQKRTLPTQVREQEKALGMAGRAGGGLGGGGGAPSGLSGNGSPIR